MLLVLGFMYGILRDVLLCFVYIDDILVASKDRPDQLLHLKKLFARLEKFGLVVNVGKFNFDQSSVFFLGHLVTAEGLMPCPDRVQAIAKCNRIEYRIFIPHATKSQIALAACLKGRKQKKTDKAGTNWTNEASTSFERCKDKLFKAAVLSYASPTVIILYRGFAVGGVL